MKDLGVSKEEFDAAMDSVAAYEKEIADHNAKILSDNNIPWEDFESVVDDCAVTGKVEIVTTPEGNDNCEDPHGVFKRIFVRQWSIGCTGDSYAGYIFAELSENKWLKIPYEC